ncbi:Siroheme synthase [Leclercia adecarboxylata]|uniref:Siroheme synthase n=1 Tax=Leclercia adecarboxylata TaxID=83655 RepID=A0A4V6JM93_9ENTR|nr:Siroheme synthase [Leclercia adecarboxylata]
MRLVTGHLKTGSELDWYNLAAEKQTLVFYMGLNQAATIQAKLLEHGMEATMPVALVENGTSIKTACGEWRVNRAGRAGAAG